MADSGDFMSIYPPDVVVVAQPTTSSPTGGNGLNTSHSSPVEQHVCSPLSTAPNSPGQVSDEYDDDDEEEEEEEEAYQRRRSADIKHLLVSPPRASLELPSLGDRKEQQQRNRVTTPEIPFDEQQPPQSNKRKLATAEEEDHDQHRFARIPIVSPLNDSTASGGRNSNNLHDANNDDRAHSPAMIRSASPRCLEEKKEPEPNPLPPKVENPSYLASKAWAIHRKRSSPPRATDIAQAYSEDESVPMDERRQQPASLQPRNNDNNKIISHTGVGSQQSPMKALQTAEREVQEMERRVQEMIQKRKDREALEQQRKQQEQHVPTTDSHSSEDSGDGEPPSLSPRSSQQYQLTGTVTSPQVDDIVFPPEIIDETPGRHSNDLSAINSTMDSGSYYYDGSAMGSSREQSSSYEPFSPTRDLSQDYDTVLEDHKQPFFDNKSSPFAGISAAKSFGEYTSQKQQQQQKETSSAFPGLSAVRSFEDFTAQSVSAFHQVGQEVNSFLMGSTPGKQHQQPNAAAKRTHEHNTSAPDSPSSDATPHTGNLSPRGPLSPARDDRADYVPLDIGYKPSDKMARARSLILDRQQRAKSPPAVPPQNNSDFRPWRNDAVTTEDQDRVVKPAEKESLSGPPDVMRVASQNKKALWSNKLDEKADNNYTSKACPVDDWPSISEMMGGYESAITESLKNLSMAADEDHGNDCGTGEGFFQNGVEALGVDITGCLQMPSLGVDEPVVTNYSRVASLQCADGHDDEHDEYEYHDKDDETDDYVDHHADDANNYDEIENEREQFARTLSERLLNLGALSPNTSSDSTEKPSPAKRSYSAGQRSNSNLYALAEGQEPSSGGDGMYTQNLPKNGYLPSSEQNSPSSEGGNKSSVSPGRLRRAQSLPAVMGNNKSGSRGRANTAVDEDAKPVLVESIDNEVGIAKGGIMLSLLCDNSFQTKDQDSWSWRVKEAIWRGREMRRHMGFARKIYDEDNDGKEVKTSLPVDVDDVRVVGGIANVSSIQEKALAHLERDEFEESLELYEDIIFNYYSFFEEVLAKRDELPAKDVSVELSNFKPYIGASLHNLGIIHLLKGDYGDAFSFFTRAVENRRACLGEGHADYVTSLVRLAICRFAMDNFADAHTNLELALALAGTKAKTSRDYCQLGEILNNLGCLSYMCGQPTKAMRLFRESMDVQLAVLNSSLYGGTDSGTHSATLNVSITRGNIGFLALVLKDVPSGIYALESALREQRLLLNPAHVTLISTMDHLAVANLLQGRAQKAVKMLKRIFEAQQAAYGPDDPRCEATRQKISTIRSQKPTAPKKPVEDIVFEAHQKRKASESEKAKKRVEGGQAKAVSVPHGQNKVNSMFKAIRSLGKKHNR